MTEKKNKIKLNTNKKEKLKKTKAVPLKITLPRVAKGKKPNYFADPATDKLLWISLSLMEELSVTRDRLDTVERLLTRKKVLKPEEIDAYQPDTAAEAQRSARRSAYIERMMRAVEAELEELTGHNMPKNHEEVIAAVES